MKFNKLGNSDLLFSEIGLGTWAIGGGEWGMGWGNQNQKDSVQTILEAFSVGINWVDTAHAYGFGVAEKAVAEALCEWKWDDVMVATKCGVLPGDGKVPRRFISADSIRIEVEGSLKRLKRDWIDLYQIHWPEPVGNLEESWQVLQELKKEGKIRWAGVCNCWKSELKVVQEIAPVTSIQPMYSMLAREIENETLPWCTKHGVGVLAYSPMHSGLLTGKVSPTWFAELPSNDWRKHKADHPVVKPLQTREGMKKFLFFQEELRELAVDTGRTIAQLAVAWTLHRQEITSSIVGARKTGQISETVDSVNLPISKEEEVKIEEIIDRFLESPADA